MEAAHEQLEGSREMSPEAASVTVTEIKSIHEDIKELKTNQQTVMTNLMEVKISMARQEERQAEAKSKLETIVNGFVTASDHSNVKTRVEKLEGWLTWILRLMVGAVVLAGLAALRIKGNI